MIVIFTATNYRASDRQCQSRNIPGFDPSILRHSRIWGAADEAVLNNVQKNSPLKKFRFYIVLLQFFHFILLISIRFASDFFLVKQFFGSFPFHFDFFALFCLFHVRFCFIFLQFRFDVKQAKSCIYFASKGNEIFASISIFASESKTRADPN